MVTFTANEAKTRFGNSLIEPNESPCRWCGTKGWLGLLVNPEDYEQMRSFYADRLRRTFAESAQEASLSEGQANELLGDES